MRGACGGVSGPAQSTAPGRPRGPSRMGATKAWSSSARRAGEEAPGELGAAFDHQRDDAALREERQRGDDVDAALGASGRAHAPRRRASASASSVASGRVGAADDTSVGISARRLRRGASAGGRRSFVSKTTRSGLGARRVAHGEARIVGERGADADGDGVVRGAEQRAPSRARRGR